MTDAFELPDVGSFSTTIRPGAWTIDPDHTGVVFSVRHLGVSRVTGRIPVTGGSIEVRTPEGDSDVEVRIAMDRIDTGSAERDRHLRSPDFFDVDLFPEATFRSTTLQLGPRLAGPHLLRGDLTLLAITKEVELEVVFAGAGSDPFGFERAFFTAHAEVDRQWWGIGSGWAMAADGLVIGHRVDLELVVEATRQADGR